MSLRQQVATFSKTLQTKNILCRTASLTILSVWNQVIYLLLFSFFCALFGMLLKGMGEIFLLSKDEPLTPNIDGVVAL